MSGTDVYVVADAGGGRCYPFLYDFDRFCDDVYARDVFWWRFSWCSCPILPPCPQICSVLMSSSSTARGRALLLETAWFKSFLCLHVMCFPNLPNTISNDLCLFSWRDHIAVISSSISIRKKWWGAIYLKRLQTTDPTLFDCLELEGCWRRSIKRGNSLQRTKISTTPTSSRTVKAQLFCSLYWMAIKGWKRIGSYVTINPANVRICTHVVQNTNSDMSRYILGTSTKLVHFDKTCL
jgi:hypothetical protein